MCSKLLCDQGNVELSAVKINLLILAINMMKNRWWKLTNTFGEGKSDSNNIFLYFFGQMFILLIHFHYKDPATAMLSMVKLSFSRTSYRSILGIVLLSYSEKKQCLHFWICPDRRSGESAWNPLKGHTDIYHQVVGVRSECDVWAKIH